MHNRLFCPERRFMREQEAAFYCVSDAHHFVGVVALLNSLRIVGHSEPLFVLDCGLEEWQRELLPRHATVLRDQSGLPPMLLKAVAPLACPAAVMVILDADVLVTRRLTPLMEVAGEGQFVAFADYNADRFFDEWAILALGEPRRQTYVASGHLFLPAEGGHELLQLFHDAQQRIDTRKTLLGNEGLVVRSTPADPFYFPDMDVLNAVLSTAVEAERLVALDYRFAPHPPFRGVKLEDASTLRCGYVDGTSPFVLHHAFRKPWLGRTRSNLYSRLLPRILLGPDVELRLDPLHLPLRLRTGRRAALDRARTDAQAIVNACVRGRLGLRPRLASWRAACRAQPNPRAYKTDQPR